MNTRKAKQIAAHYLLIDFFYDSHIRLWTCSDVRCFSSSDWVSPGWLREYTEVQLKEWFEYMSGQFAEDNDLGDVVYYDDGILSKHTCEDAS